MATLHKSQHSEEERDGIFSWLYHEREYHYFLLEALNRVLQVSWHELDTFAIADPNPVTEGMPNADCVFELLSHWMER